MSRRAIVAAASVLALTGCGASDDEPAPPALPAVERPSTSTPIPVPSPSLSGVEGEVEAAALAYIGGVNRAIATGDLSTYTPLHTADCTACAAFTDLVRDTAARGERFVGAGDVVTSYEVTEVTGDRATVDLRYTAPPYDIVRADGSVAGSYAEDRVRKTLGLRREDGQWRVAQVTRRPA